MTLVTVGVLHVPIVLIVWLAVDSGGTACDGFGTGHGEMWTRGDVIWIVKCEENL